MVRWWKLGFVAVGTGVMIGSAAVGWLYLHRDTGEAAAAKRGTRTLEDETLNSASSSGPSDALTVTTNGTQGLAQGQSIGGGSGAGGPGGTGSSESGIGSDRASGGGTDQLPTPSQFHVYDQYKNSPTALYIDVKPGDGKAVAKGSVVTIQYRGWLTDGKEFDESYAGGKPYTFTEGAGTVIEGMAQALFGMKVGGQRRLIIPPAVGYGAAGHDPIPPDAVMVFDVELVSVQ